MIFRIFCQGWLLSILLATSLWAQSGDVSEAIAPTPLLTEPVLSSPEEEVPHTPALLVWVREAMQLQVGENSFFQIALSFFILLGAFVLRKIVLYVFFAWLLRLAQRTTWKIDAQLVPALSAPVSAFVMAVGVFAAVGVLQLEPGITTLLVRLFQATTMVIVFWGVLRVTDVLADAVAEHATRKQMGIATFLPLLKKAARIFLVAIGVILVIQNLGYSVGSLLAGLGIGGLAVALAAQESLSNFFGSISLVADRPFKIGDWIQVGNEIDGDVEEIGLRSTRVRTWAKSQLTIPNKVLANQIIENWTRMPKRRVRQIVGVTYETTPEEMEALVEDIRTILRRDADIDQDLVLVNFTDFGASSLDILVYYFTKTTRWVPHLEVRQRINLEIMRAIKARGLSVAFPTRTLYLEGDIARQLATRGRDLPGPDAT